MKTIFSDDDELLTLVMDLADVKELKTFTNACSVIPRRKTVWSPRAGDF